MGATLASREDSVVNTFLKIRRVLEVFPEEDKTGTGTTKSLVAAKMCSAAPKIKKKKKEHTWWW